MRQASKISADIELFCIEDLCAKPRGKRDSRSETKQDTYRWVVSNFRGLLPYPFAKANIFARWFVAAWIAILTLICILPKTAVAQSSNLSELVVSTPIRTDDPRETFESFLRLNSEMEVAVDDYMSNPTFAGVSRLAFLSDELNALLDLQNEPRSNRRETGIRTMTYLMDIFGRLPPIDLSTIPDAEQMEALGYTTTRIPNTPIYIVQLTEGYRQGEYVFAASTVGIAPRFFRSIQNLPLRTNLPTESWNALGPQLTGPLVPPALVAAIPERLKSLWLDTPAWKVITTITAAVILLGMALIVNKIVLWIKPKARLTQLALNSILPIALLLVASLLLPAFSFQINVSGRFSDGLAQFKTIISFVSIAWLFWIFIKLIFEFVILSPRIPDSSLNANLLRLVANVLGIIGVTIILAFGGQAIGLPVLSVLAGLGIGGLAVALALRPTLENLIGGVILYMDRPVRLGDFCKFGNEMGTIESIGVRSTKLRALDRTLITVPNAQFADMQIVNFASCDRMLFQQTIGVRYETTPDQLRFLLAKIRAMLHSHPRVERETVRVRLASFGSSSLDIDLRVYIETREWNDYFAIREDINFRIYELVEEAGSGFAFPSQTLYFSKDRGLNSDLSINAETKVDEWRAQGKLPFPRFSQQEMDRLQGTLRYPPQGSYADQMEDAPAEEPLSSEDPESAEEQNK